jgi:hypothetical protein
MSMKADENTSQLPFDAKCCSVTEKIRRRSYVSHNYIRGPILEDEL